MEKYINKITHADCMDILKQLPSNCIDLVLTDFPYTEVNRPSNGLRNLYKGCADELDIDLPVLLWELIRVCKGSFYAFCGTEQVSQTRKALVDAGFSTRLLIWEKTNPSPMNGQHIWLSGIECCVYGKTKYGVFNESRPRAFSRNSKAACLVFISCFSIKQQGGFSIRPFQRERNNRRGVP